MGGIPDGQWTGDPEAAGAAAASTAAEPFVSGLGSAIADTVQQLAQGIWSGVKIPGEVASGERAPTEDAALKFLPYLMGGGGPRDALGSGPIRAYHGSPHDFETFDSAKIGTGEGAQVYGHGLYFAENPNVAESYRASLSHGAGYGTIPADVLGALRSVDYFGFETPGEGLAAARGHADWRDRWPGMPDKSDPPAYDVIQSYLDNTRRGKTYEVQLHADPEEFLHWDKPLSEQSPQVREAMLSQPEVQKMIEGQASVLGNKARDPTGQAAYAALANGRRGVDLSPSAESATSVSQRLLNLGIPGIRYLDQGSRGPTGKPTHNFVMFDPERISIDRKYADGGEVLDDPGAVGAAEQGGSVAPQPVPAYEFRDVGWNVPPVMPPRMF